MAVQPNNVVQGPATIYAGSFGVSEPPDTNAAIVNVPNAFGTWSDCGATTGGVQWEVDHTYGKINADQLVDPIGARLTARAITVTFNLLEATLANLNLAMNNLGTLAILTGVSTFDPQTTTSATQPTYTALLIDGWAPTLVSGLPAKRRFIIRKCLNEVKAMAKYDMTTQVTWNCTFTAYYVSSSIAPFHVVDQTA